MWKFEKKVVKNWKILKKKCFTKIENFGKNF